MSDFINKVVTVILVFVMFIMAPMILSYKTDDMLAKREILNDVEMFIDKVQDTSSISQNDLDKLYIDCNSHGLNVNVQVKRLIATAVFDPDADGGKGVAQTNYFAVDDEESLKDINAGDIIHVHISEVTTSSSRIATYRILGIDEGPLNFSLAGVVG